jgi:hypothetical protein
MFKLLSLPLLDPRDPSDRLDVMSIVCDLTFAGGEKTASVVECVDGEVDSFGLE